METRPTKKRGKSTAEAAMPKPKPRSAASKRKVGKEEPAQEHPDENEDGWYQPAVRPTYSAGHNPSSPKYGPSSPVRYYPSSPKYGPSSPVRYYPSSPKYGPSSPVGYYPSSPKYGPSSPVGYCPSSPMYSPESPVGYIVLQPGQPFPFAQFAPNLKMKRSKKKKTQ